MLRHRCSIFYAVLFALGVFCLGGCSYLARPRPAPKPQVKSLTGTQAERTVTLRSLQLEVMRFADNYAGAVARAADNYGAGDSNTLARMIATKWKLEQATAAYIDASGPNPVINALDMVVLANVSRMVIEEQVNNGRLGASATSLLETHQMLSSNSWAIARGVLKPEQQKELLSLIVEWRKANPRLSNATGLRFREFMTAIGKGSERDRASAPTSVFSLLFIDPMASMDPTTAAIEETRNTAERAMYYSQRLPTLLNWQVELLTYELASQPETKQLLQDTKRFTTASEAFAKSAEKWPAVLAEQREAAIKQILEGLAPEEKRVKELLAEARQLAMESRETLKAGDATATSIDQAIKSLDRFVASVSNDNGDSKGTDRRPFDVLDYATAARDIGAAAKELNVLLASAKDSTAVLRDLEARASSHATSAIDHAYKRALTLVIVALAGALLAGIIYRLVGSRSRV